MPKEISFKVIFERSLKHNHGDRLKKNISALLLSIVLGLGLLGGAPAQAATGDCTFYMNDATCTGSNQEALRGNSEVKYLTLENSTLQGDVLAAMPNLRGVFYSANIDVNLQADLKQALKAPALNYLQVGISGDQNRVLTGETFSVKPFTTFDGSQFRYELEEGLTDWDEPPVKEVGANTFKALKSRDIVFLKNYIEGTLDIDGRSINYGIGLDGMTFMSSYEYLSWLGTGKLSAYFSPEDSGNLLSGIPSTVPTGTWLKVSGTKTSTGYPLKTTCTWKREGVVVQKAKTESDGGCDYKLTKADSGKQITVTAKHDDWWGSSEGLLSTTDMFSKKVTVIDPVVLKLGKIGAVSVGKKITPKITGAPAGTKFTYQWYRNGSKIKGATGATYTPVPADLKGYISYQAKGSKTGMFSVPYTSYNSEKVATGRFTVTKAPSISGKTVFGQSVKVSPGSRSVKPGKFTYQWQRDGKKIKGATKTTYKLGLADIGKKISVKVTASGAGMYTQTSTATKNQLIAKASFTVKKKPTVSGKVKAGTKMTAKAGTWSPKPDKFTYQWYRSGAPITKATKSTYKVTSRDRGKVIYVKVTANKEGYSSKTSTSSVN